MKHFLRELRAALILIGFALGFLAFFGAIYVLDKVRICL